MSDTADCLSCGEGDPRGECPHSETPCGHHCNHSWTHDQCCWCLAEWGDDSAPASPVNPVTPEGGDA